MYTVSGCNIAGVDLVFVLDSSGSIGATNFNSMRNFVTTVVNALNIGQNRSQVGVIVFSDVVRIQFHLNTYSNKASLLSAIPSIPYIGSGTNTADALYTLINEGFDGARPVSQGIPRVAIVVTDGKSSDPDRTVQAAAVLHQTSFMTYAVGIRGADINELNTIASTQYGEKLVRNISSFNPDELEHLREDLREQACTGN